VCYETYTSYEAKSPLKESLFTHTIESSATRTAPQELVLLMYRFTALLRDKEMYLLMREGLRNLRYSLLTKNIR
jgi:hypothetical protein